ncbi:hypothetical protein PFJ87_11g02200 [Encephalitozoon hellem]|uniref:Tim44-like domain-containing protein n=1 Tax=Encephalitozoon hellem TaxID=27973 RepID=A0ABY8CNK9_ENCHE|nr:hypothetical protein PFJ87_07g02120 [Encephalitozoon hellem]WEL39575.1 hypothetical protein PFJ87_10g00190 [Encephalitozoon hellem]WEL39982.1 hypothetical protein PFJ87_11g02200 [Encephalitozoon hellem]
MGRLWRAARSWASVFGRNLWREFDGSEELKGACERMARGWMACRDAVEDTRLFRVGRRMMEVSSSVMRASDASIGIALRAGGGLLCRRREFQRRLDMVFRIPQYYGGVRSSGPSVAAKDGSGECLRKRGGLVEYRGSVMKRIWRLCSVVKSRLSSDERAIEEIENRCVGEILRGLGSEPVSGLCTEEGMEDLKNLALEVGGGRDVWTTDIRNTSTSGSVAKGMFECEFEAEIATGDRMCVGGDRHVFLIRGRFVNGAGCEDGGWYLSSLAWTRIG